jgi:hypothetical protein
MPLVLVDGMPLEPHACVCCSKGPRGGDGEIRKNIFAEAVDINWGDSVYICPECAVRMAELMGYVTPEDAEELKRRIKELEEIEQAHEALKERVHKILEGNRAKKEVVDDA